MFTGAMANWLPKKKAFRIEEMKPKDPTAKRMKIIYGPYTLKAANVSQRYPELNDY